MKEYCLLRNIYSSHTFIHSVYKILHLMLSIFIDWKSFPVAVQNEEPIKFFHFFFNSRVVFRGKRRSRNAKTSIHPQQINHERVPSNFVQNAYGGQRP